MDTNGTTLRDRVALVTGGGSGLGAALCDELGRAGMRVAIADLRPDPAERTAERLRREGVDAIALAADVGDPESAARTVGRVLERFGSLDALVNNAGTDVTAPVEAIDPQAWRTVLATNLDGPFLLSRAALPALRAHQGQIVNIASTAAKRAWPNASAYHASKWGLLGLSHAMHAEFRASGVRVTAVICGGMRTPFLLDRFPDIDPTRLQAPERVAEAVRFVLGMPPETVIAEITVLPRLESSWP